MSDRRQAHRIAASAERQDAVLKVGDESIPARLVDESSTGIALQVDAHPGVYEGETVWVQAAGSWTKARVARIRHEDSGIELGLLRVTDEEDEPVVAEPKPWLRVWKLPENRRVPIVIALAVLLTVSLVTLLRHWQEPPAEAKVQANQAADQSERRYTDVQEKIHELGATPFLAPEIASRLELSKRQVQHIQGIVARSQQAEELAERTGATAEHIRRIRLEAQFDARQVLNRQQRARWDEMMRLVEEKDAALD